MWSKKDEKTYNRHYINANYYFFTKWYLLNTLHFGVEKEDPLVFNLYFLVLLCILISINNFKNTCEIKGISKQWKGTKQELEKK